MKGLLRRSFLVFLLLISIFSSALAHASNSESMNGPENQPQINKIVTVGYNREDRKELFGDLSDIEIRKILHKKIDDLMESGNRATLSSYDNHIVDLNDKLIISFIDKETGIQFNNSEELYSDNVLMPFAYDEKPVSAYIDYSVGFDVNNMGVFYGDYVSIIEGVVNTGHYAVIEDLTTMNIGGARFPVRDYVHGDETAHNAFYSLDSQSFRFGRGDFAINRTTGKVIFYGVS